MSQPLELFMGPCVLESEDLAKTIAESLLRDLEEFGDDISLTFKGSFDKANRTSIDSYRGPGIDEGLKILEMIKSQYKLPVLTDFHSPDQAQTVAKVVDVLQIPAFLCRQTDLIVAGAKACSEHGARLNIKKGQFLAPEQTENMVNKAKNFLSLDKIILTERGTCFGYGGLIVDMASFGIMKSFGVQTCHDATHSVQVLGGKGTSSGGKPEQVLPLAKAALAAGADSLFMEVHPSPAQSKSDAATILDMSKVKGMVRELLKIYKAV